MPNAHNNQVIIMSIHLYSLYRWLSLALHLQNNVVPNLPKKKMTFHPKIDHFLHSIKAPKERASSINALQLYIKIIQQMAFQRAFQCQQILLPIILKIMVYKCEYCAKTFAKNKALFLAHKRTCVVPPVSLPSKHESEELPIIPIVESKDFQALFAPIERNRREWGPPADYEPEAPTITEGIHDNDMPVLNRHGRYPLSDPDRFKGQIELVYADDRVTMPNQPKYKSKICQYIRQNRGDEGIEDELAVMDNSQTILQSPMSFLKRKTMAEWAYFRHRHLDAYYQGKNWKRHFMHSGAQVLRERSFFSNFNWWVKCHQYLRQVECVNGATFFTQTDDQAQMRRRGANSHTPPMPVNYKELNVVPRIKRRMRKHHEIMEDIHRKKLETQMRFPPSIYDSRRYEDSPDPVIPSELEQEEE